MSLGTLKMTVKPGKRGELLQVLRGTLGPTRALLVHFTLPR